MSHVVSGGRGRTLTEEGIHIGTGDESAAVATASRCCSSRPPMAFGWRFRWSSLLAWKSSRNRFSNTSGTRDVVQYRGEILTPSSTFVSELSRLAGTRTESTCPTRTANSRAGRHASGRRVCAGARSIASGWSLPASSTSSKRRSQSRSRATCRPGVLFNAVVQGSRDGGFLERGRDDSGSMAVPPPANSPGSAAH